MNKANYCMSVILIVLITSSLAMQLFSVINSSATRNVYGASNTTGTTDTTNTTNQLKSSLLNQSSSANTIPTTNLTTASNLTTELRAGDLNYDGLTIPIIYQKLTNDTGLFEGDILLRNTVTGGKAAPDSFTTTSKWPNGMIPVILHPDVPNRENIIQAMMHVMENTPILFRPVEIQDGRIVDENYLVFYPSEEMCASDLGMAGGPQAIIVPDWCKTGSLVHEILHTAGIWHEQTRCDRDQNIDIIEENIQPDWITQFNAVCDPQRPSESPVSFGSYDYCSIMHYPRFGSERSAIDPNQPIMVPKNQVVGCEDIGQRNGLSPLDIAALETIYPFPG